MKKVLELHGNSIHTVDGSLKSSALSLIHLRLHNNNFTEFPETLPVTVKALVLMNNNIHSISKRALILDLNVIIKSNFTFKGVVSAPGR